MEPIYCDITLEVLRTFEVDRCDVLTFFLFLAMFLTRFLCVYLACVLSWLLFVLGSKLGSNERKKEMEETLKRSPNALWPPLGAQGLLEGLAGAREPISDPDSYGS